MPKGNPKYKGGDVVRFNCCGKELKGVVMIVDPWGTFEDDSNAYYDILVESENCLYKHLNEKCVLSDDA